MTQNEASKNLLGRGVIIVLPLVIIVMAVLIMFPTRYYYKVSDGQLNLWVGKLGWLDAQQSKAMESIPVGTADFKQLTQQSFDTEGEALAAISSLIVTRIDEQKQKLFPLEKQLWDIYRELLGYLKVAQKIGVQENEHEIAVVQSWLDRYQSIQQQEHVARSKRITGSETFPYEIVSRSEEKAAVKAVQEKIKQEAQGGGHGGENPSNPGQSKAEHK